MDVLPGNGIKCLQNKRKTAALPRVERRSRLRLQKQGDQASNTPNTTMPMTTSTIIR